MYLSKKWGRYVNKKQIRRVIVTFLPVVIGIIIGISKNHVTYASGNSLDSSVTKLEAKHVGEDRYKVFGSFKSDKVIQSGDYLTFTWGKNAVAFANKKSVYVGDLRVGEMKVNDGEAKLTFDDNISKRPIYGGEVSLDLEVNDDEIVTFGKKDVQLSADKKKVDKKFASILANVNISDNKNYVKYVFDLNNDSEELDSDLVFDEKLSAGQKITDIVITVDGKKYDLVAFQEEFPKAKVKIADQSFSISLDQEDANKKKLIVEVKARVLEEKNFYESNGSVKYQLKDKGEEKYELVTKVKNFDLDVTLMQAYSGILQIVKLYQDKDGKVKPLEGVTFLISKQNGQEIGTFTTDKEGLINVKDLEYGTYVLKEVKAPDFIDLDEVKDKTWSVEIKDNAGKPFIIINNLKKEKSAEKVKTNKDITLFDSDKKKVADSIPSKSSDFKAVTPKNEAAKTLSKVGIVKEVSNSRKHNTRSQSHEDTDEESSDKKSSKLPKAGEVSSNMWILTGIFMICLVFSVSAIRLAKQHKK